jgi:hypothetical protein
MAHIEYIEANSTDSHQVSPACQLTFLRWNVRDTEHNGDGTNKQDLKDPFIVINDCVQLSINSNKSSHVHQMSAILMGGDFNYSTAIAPGDFVLVNMVNSDEVLFGKNGTPQTPSSSSLYARARAKNSINRVNDGFKGIFKIQSVRRILTVAPNGVKMFHYQLAGSAFTEFNQVVYFNPYLFNTDTKNLERASGLLNTDASKEWAENFKKDKNNISSIFKSLVGFLIGKGFPADYVEQKKDVVINHNKNFMIPSEVGNLLGLSKSSNLKAADMFNYQVGIQQYDGNSLNPISMTKDGMFYVGKELSGSVLMQAEPWSSVTAWSILNQYTNSLINEIYTSFKQMPNGTIMPCVVLRQKPFTSKQFVIDEPTIPTTPFLSIPRWKISPDLIVSLSLGRDEVARINFVHIIGKTRYVDIKDQVAQQASSKLFQEDSDDIQRNGLRPFISACDFDFPTDESKLSKSGIWNKLMFDWLNNGHLKENGTLVCAGLQENIAIGDNVQIEDTVLHIESVNHVMQIDANGNKTFRTTLQLSYGVDTGANGIYPEMYSENAKDYRIKDFNHTDKSKNNKKDGGLLPGYSDSQDIGGRTNAEDTLNNINKKSK